jgi:hypothetical protein
VKTEIKICKEGKFNSESYFEMKLVPEAKCIKDTRFSYDPTNSDQVLLTTFENCKERRAIKQVYVFNLVTAVKTKKYEFNLKPGTDKKFNENRILEEDRICLWKHAVLFYNLEKKKLWATPMLADKKVSRNWYSFDIEKFQFDEMYKIGCHSNGYFTVLLKDKRNAQCIVVTFNTLKLEEPETRIFDIYKLNKYPQ